MPLSKPNRRSRSQSRRYSVQEQAKHLRWLCALALVVCAAPTFLGAETRTPKHRTVVVISLDGFPAYALDDPRLPIPTLRKLAREGAVARSMRPVNPTVTWPNHTAIVTGGSSSRLSIKFFITACWCVRMAEPDRRLSLGATKNRWFMPRPSTTQLTKQGSPPRRWIGSPSIDRRPSPGSFRSCPTPTARSSAS